MRVGPGSLSLCGFLLLGGVCSQAQVPEPAPGLRIPSGAVPYALDHFAGLPELVPVHHSAVELNNHRGANVAGSLAGSFFYKPKATVELPGLHARTVLHDLKPSFYLRREQDPDGSPSADDGMTMALVRAVPDKDHRLLAQIRFTQLTGNSKRSDGVVETVTEDLPDGWKKITPRAPLEPGEYALEPIPRTQNAYSTTVFDFSLAPAAPNATDAVMAVHAAEQPAPE